MNQQQIDRYLERIGFDGPINHDGDTLDRLIWAHISTVPFESLDLHEYGIVPSLNIDDLYEKFVVKRRGGYCFEQNTIFGQLLNDLGFPTYATVVRLLGPPIRPNDFFIERKTDDGWANVLYFAQRPIEPCDFEPLNFYCAMQPNSGFRLNRTVNLTLPNGSKALSGKHFTLRRDGVVTEKDIQTPDELEELLREEFGIVMHIPRWKRF